MAQPEEWNIHITLTLDGDKAAQLANAISALLTAVAPGDGHDITTDIEVNQLRAHTMHGDPAEWKPRPLACPR